ncbi:MAG: TolC family protein [Thermodesulfobacteriota bacterium]|nr:TolC family protein [Thermodesulfobacteriota bacterium]
MANLIAIFLGLIIAISSPFITVVTAGDSIIDILQGFPSSPDKNIEMSGQPGGPKSPGVFSAPSIEIKTLPDMPPKSGKGPLESEGILKLFRPGDSSDKNNHMADQKSIRLTLTLQELEKNFRAAPEVLIALAELEESLSLLEQKQAQSGLKIFGGAGMGAYQEPVTNNVIRNFQRIRVGLGVRYPLLGSLEKERIDLLKAEARTKEKKEKIELISRTSLSTLRTYYIKYWGSLRKMDLCEAFLQNEQEAEDILERRTRAGYLLDADRQKLLTSFALVRKNLAHNQTINNRSLNILKLLTEPELNDFTPAAPLLPKPCQDIVKLRATVLDTHPEINLLRKQVEEKLELLQATSNSAMEANVDLAGISSTDFPEKQAGYGVAINFNIQLPVHFKKVGTARKALAQVALKKTQLQLDLKNATLSGEAEDALNRFVAASENAHFATQHLKTEMESVREDLLRYAYLEGDTIKKLQQSRFNYYQSAMNYIEVEIDKLQTQTKLLQFCPGGCQLKTVESAVKKVRNQPMGPDNRLSMDRQQKMEGLPSVLAHSQVFPVRSELYRNNIRQASRHDLFTVKKSALTSDYKPESSQWQPATLNTSTPSFSDYYTVQVGSYRHLAGAKKCMRALEGIDHNVVIRAVELSEKGRMYRIHVGEFTDNGDAKKLVKYLADEYGHKAFVAYLKH